MKGGQYYRNECLWCHKEFRGLLDGYCFCGNCLDNLHIIGEITGNPEITEQVDIFMKKERELK